MSAERPLDRLLPQAIALVFGVGALAAGLAGIAADTFIGRPSSTSGIGVVVIFPLVLFAAIIGFALGHMLGVWLRRRGLVPQVRMRPYRVILALVLVAVTALGATLGARPVIRHERTHTPRVITGDGSFSKDAGAPDGCTLRPATLVCSISEQMSSGSLSWNGREIAIGCTREGRISVSDQVSGQLASIDLSEFEYVRDVFAAPMRQAEGREGLALLATLRATGRRHVLAMIDPDGRVVYQELLEGHRQGDALAPLSVCESDDASGVVVDLGAPVTYRAR